jgi:tripartite-type tricarboxylate transporter receptor subunit TctC
MRQRALALVLGTFLPTIGIFGGTSAQAQTAFPSRPVVIKLAFPAGGSADASVRAAQVVIQRSLSQTVVIENLPGANGSLAAMNVLRSQPDGYTLLGITGTDFLVSPLTVPSAKHHPNTFKLLGITGVGDLALVSSPRHSFANVEALIAYAKDSSHKPLTIAHWGVGSAPHLVAADFQNRVGLKFVDVPYKGAAPVANDLAGDHIDLAFVPLGGPTLGLVRGGKMKVIGIAAERRDRALPEVPTLGETAALKGFVYTLWVGVLAPPGTPEPVVARLTKALNDWSASTEAAERALSTMSRPGPIATAAENAAFLQSEYEKYTNIAKALKLEPE